LKDGSDDGLAVTTTAMDATRLNFLVHVASLATDKGFVALYFASQLAAGAFILHRKANSMEHEPSGLLGDAESPVKFPGADPITVAGNHPHRREPFVQAEWRILKYGPDLDGELGQRVTSSALPYPARGDVANVLGAAARTNHHAIRPTARRKVVDAMIGVRKVLNRFDQSAWSGIGGVHISTLAGMF
jgi:hypothetical protein